MAPDKNEKRNYGELDSASGFATSLGEKNLQTSSDFMRAIVSGDSAAISKMLAPQIAGLQQRAQQQRQQVGQFGGRSGGSTASMNASGDAAMASVNDMITSLTGGSVSGLASSGGGLLNTGIYGKGMAFDQAKTMHDQNLAKWNDIFKSSAQVAEAGFGAMGGAPGGMGDMGSNFAGSFS